MAKDIGPELVQFLSPEDRLNGLSRADLLKYLSDNAQQCPLNAAERRILQQLLADRTDS